MRILDKHTDFYDYLQNIYRDDTFTFDRRDSFILTNEFVCHYMDLGRPVWRDSKIGLRSYFLLQVCNTFWLFLVEVTKVDANGHTDDYQVTPLECWKNYNKKREILKLDTLWFSYPIHKYLRSPNSWATSRDDVIANKAVLVDAINGNDYKVEDNMNKCKVSIAGNESEWRHLPIFIETRFAKAIDPQEIYLAIEEYFSLERTESERTESKDLTNKEKIENHGFDTKTSFRGKCC